MAVFDNISDILNAPLDHLKAALRVLCSKNGDVQKTLTEYLSTLHQSEFHLCERCEETFFDSENKHGECKYHDGECEQNEDAEIWEEWEEWREGPMTLVEKDEHPEGFIWTCCKGDGDAKPCEVGVHKPQDKITVATQPDAGVGVKRKRNDDDASLRICGLCNKTFDEGANGQSACSYHPAPLEFK